MATLQAISLEHPVEENQNKSFSEGEINDSSLLDAYSQAVIRASELVSPSVVHITVKKRTNLPARVRSRGRQGGAGCEAES